jgi:Saxitoxin biosynthesis operon protein SxtJ
MRMKRQDDKKQLRHFGLIVGGIFAVIGLWPMVFRAEAPRLWALVLAVALVIPALVLPRSLTYVHRVWMAAGEALGWVNTRIILSVIFYGLVTPMGIIMRRFGRDPMQRRFEPGVATYRVPKAARSGAHMTRQF